MARQVKIAEEARVDREVVEPVTRPCTWEISGEVCKYPVVGKDLFCRACNYKQFHFDTYQKTHIKSMVEEAAHARYMWTLSNARARAAILKPILAAVGVDGATPPYITELSLEADRNLHQLEQTNCSAQVQEATTEWIAESARRSGKPSTATTVVEPADARREAILTYILDHIKTAPNDMTVSEFIRTQKEELARLSDQEVATMLTYTNNDTAVKPAMYVKNGQLVILF